jgi:cephalosporin hydroxylase
MGKKRAISGYDAPTLPYIATDGHFEAADYNRHHHMKLVIDTLERTLTRQDEGLETTCGLFTKEAFEAISREWVRVGWSLAYYHSFSWFGLPTLQLPEDLIRMQEVIYRVKPRIIIETGVFQGGSMLFYAAILEAMGEGKVIGIDLQIPGFVRQNIESHPLSSRITLLEGSSTDSAIVEQVRQAVGSTGPVLVILDSDHSKKHVIEELELYAPFVTPGSYIVATDGIMKDLWDVPRAVPEWKTDNPYTAAREFAARHPEFLNEQPKWAYTEGKLTENVTYFPDGWFQRI